MKEFRICIIATIIVSLILISTALAFPAQAEANPITSEDYYGKLVVVRSSIQLEISIWVVDCEDKDGNIWTFLNDTGDLRQGDILTLLMFRVNNNIEDDECMEYMYEGHTDNPETFFEVVGWR